MKFNLKRTNKGPIKNLIFDLTGPSYAKRAWSQRRIVNNNLDSYFFFFFFLMLSNAGSCDPYISGEKEKFIKRKGGGLWACDPSFED